MFAVCDLRSKTTASLLFAAEPFDLILSVQPVEDSSCGTSHPFFVLAGWFFLGHEFPQHGMAPTVI
jgi:hypothetical protein